VRHNRFAADLRRSRSFRLIHPGIGTLRMMLVPAPAAVWISNFPSICAALVRMLCNPKPSLFSRLALEIPDPLSFTRRMRLGGSQRSVTLTLIGNIQLKRFNSMPFFSQFLSDGFSLLIVSAPENYVNVLANQFTCGLQSQTAVAAGDQRDASICVLYGEILASFLSGQKRILDILMMMIDHCIAHLLFKR
jgi:hypothetical protein